MKTPEDIINRFINEENVKFNQERDDWMIEAMEEYAKLYHESEVKKLNIPAVMPALQHSDDMCFHECPDCNCRCNCSNQPCSCCNGA